MESKRTQASRSAATRAALVTAGRDLFGEKGYAAVGTDELARAAGVTRGALYHQFDGKRELFEAVFETVEAALSQHIGAQLAAAVDAENPLEVLVLAVDAWLAASADPATHRILLIEAPAVLGWARWRELGRAYAVGMLESALASLMAAGLVAEQPVRPLAHVVSGAVEEAALYAAEARAGGEDPDRAYSEVRDSLLLLLEGMLIGPGG